MTNEEAIKQLRDASDNEVRYGDTEHHYNEVMKRIEAFELAIKALEQQPTRPTGRWIDIQYFKADDTYYRPKCPFCSIEPQEYSNYCPNCGCKMMEVG